MNTYELQARMKKRDALVMALRRQGVSAATARAFTLSQWMEAADAARVKLPSAETRAMVIECLEGR